MKLYKDYILLKYFLSVNNKIYDVEYIGFEYSECLPNQEHLSHPYYFVFDCKYKYYHNELISYTKVISKNYLELSIKVSLYNNSNKYYIKFNDLFSCLNDNLVTSLCLNDYSELNLYEFYRDVEDLAKYFEINFGLEVRKD